MKTCMAQLHTHWPESEADHKKQQWSLKSNAYKVLPLSVFVIPRNYKQKQDPPPPQKKKKNFSILSTTEGHLRMNKYHQKSAHIHTSETTLKGDLQTQRFRVHKTAPWLLCTVFISFFDKGTTLPKTCLVQLVAR